MQLKELWRRYCFWADCGKSFDDFLQMPPREMVIFMLKSGSRYSLLGILLGLVLVLLLKIWEVISVWVILMVIGGCYIYCKIKKHEELMRQRQQLQCAIEGEMLWCSLRQYVVVPALKSMCDGRRIDLELIEPHVVPAGYGFELFVDMEYLEGREVAFRHKMERSLSKLIGMSLKEVRATGMVSVYGNIVQICM